MIQILYNETEANVRWEAASLLCGIYEHQSFSKSVIEKVDQAMVYAVTSDLHWEVKSNALCYWSKAINNRLANQGMIDGSFPSVTFSKENRKIVTLTDTEIKNRLNKVLVELSKCGCLGVLVAAMQDESDLEVAKKAVKITKQLAELLNLHTVNSENACITPTSPKAVMDTFNLVSSSPTTRFSEDVINEIVNCRDVNLLANVYIKDEGSCPVTNGAEVQLKIVTPKEFLDFIQRNLDDLIVEREKWLDKIDDLGSLLDDMLKTYDDDDMNAMDCY